MQVYGQDGVAYSQLSFTTTASGTFFRGPVPSGAVGVQVSVRGGSWQDSPDVIDFGTTDWLCPASGSLPLNHGLNDILFRPVMADGSVGSQAQVQVWRVPQTAVRRDPPASIQALRQPGGVELVVEVPDDPEVKGVYIYGSPSTGGPYSRLNRAAVSSYETTEELVSLGDLTVQQALVRNPDQSLVADPTYLKVLVQQEDLAGALVSADLSDRLEMPDDVGDYRVDLSVKQVTVKYVAKFTHIRAGTNTDNHIPNSLLAGLSDDQPVYYVATLLYFDGVTEQESSFTPEISSSPLSLGLSVGTYPSVSRQQILEDQISLTLAKQPSLGVQAGSVARDLYLEPFATESARLRFLVDFLHRCGSFETLLEIDDPFGQGSVSVSSSTYKRALKDALFLSSDQAVQDVIDQAFERLAARFGVSRPTGKHAMGSVTLWTSTRPQSSITIPVGTIALAGGIQFRTLANAVIDANQVATIYNPLTGRYSVTVSARAEAVGTVGNVAPDQIRILSPAVPGVSVTNPGYFSDGQDQYTNRQLAAEAERALSGADTGTLAGISRWVAKQSGVQGFRIVGSTDPLMYRASKGAVDIWVKSSGTQQLTDTFALSYGTRRGYVWEPLDDSGLLWQAQDASLSESQSFVEFLTGNWGIGLRNITKGLNFDLTGFTVVDYRTIRLSESYAQPLVAATDVVLGDYRVLQTSSYVFARQPVAELVSVVGTTSGNVDAQMQYSDDPQQLGRSNTSQDAVVLSGDTLGEYSAVTEQHVLSGESREYLDHLGTDTRSIVVTDLDGNLTYNGPWTSSPDYLVGEGTSTTPAWISRVLGAQISDGQEVLVTCQAAENFVATYKVPTVVERVSQAIAQNKHITADLVVKASPEMKFDLTCTVKPQPGVENTSSISQAITNALTALLADLPLGGTVDPSDVVEAIKSQNGVKSVRLPLSRMSAGDGSTVLMESLLSDSVAISNWSTDQQVVWILTDPLNFATTLNGGDHWAGVYQGQTRLTFGVLGSLAAGQAVILPLEGSSLPGYSDDATLQALLPSGATQQDLADLRKSRTGNRVVVALSPSTPASDQNWAVSYTVLGDTGSRELVCGPLGYWSLGQVQITFDRG